MTQLKNKQIDENEKCKKYKKIKYENIDVFKIMFCLNIFFIH